MWLIFSYLFATLKMVKKNFFWRMAYTENCQIFIIFSYNLSYGENRWQRGAAKQESVRREGHKGEIEIQCNCLPILVTIWVGNYEGPCGAHLPQQIFG